MGFLGFGDIFYQINYRFDEPIDLYNVFIPLFIYTFAKAGINLRIERESQYYIDFKGDHGFYGEINPVGKRCVGDNLYVFTQFYLTVNRSKRSDVSEEQFGSILMQFYDVLSQHIKMHSFSATKKGKIWENIHSPGIE